MAYYAEEDEYEQDLPEVAEEQHMEERLVKVLGYNVQDSVNQALIKALKPFTQPLTRFGHRELRGHSLLETGSQHDQNMDVGFTRRASKGPPSSTENLVHMAASVIKDHEYGSFPALDFPETGMESSIRTGGSIPPQIPYPQVLIMIKLNPNLLETARELHEDWLGHSLPALIWSLGGCGSNSPVYYIAEVGEGSSGNVELV
ncbi:hypothetical protein NDU88_006208 [Pleurodeles waltl]|uniref:Uncharacterized protein n=1 Tax=Pleurodeles waltl TaxID=8319 RepID=A0AAV7WCX8_PLEWA|nr:hypothetical protein NDU88_006208 [Pleurodeles waltl]